MLGMLCKVYVTTVGGLLRPLQTAGLKDWRGTTGGGLKHLRVVLSYPGSLFSVGR